MAIRINVGRGRTAASSGAMKNARIDDHHNEIMTSGSSLERMLEVLSAAGLS